MSESTHHPRQPLNPEPVGSTTPQPQSNLDERVQPAAHILGHPADAVDDAPTIISKGVKSGPRPEDTFAQTLRGRRLSHFDLIEPIGVGGMAAVIRATDTQLDRSVALKILPPEMASDPENIRRFQQEARAAAKLDHENIARVFAFGEDQGLHYIAFEFVEGENLRLILERRGRLPIPEAVHYMLQIATGLAHAAERGVVHRDIKPSNIIIGPTGRAKLVDMGLARSMVPVGDELTQSGVTLGTFDYISPEQALEPRSADVRSDIYSLGCTFYQMLTGQAPVPEGTAAKKLHHHQHINPIDPRQLNPAIPDDLAAILSRMMAKDPRNRYQKPEHLVQHLIQLAQKLGTATQADGVLFVDAPLPAPPTFRPLLVGAVAAVLLVTLVVLHGMSSWSAPQPRFLKREIGPGVILPPVDPPKDVGKATIEPVVQTVPTVNPTRKTVPVESAAEFIEALTGSTGDVDIELLKEIDFATLTGSEPGAKAPEYTIKRNVTIKPKGGNRVTIRLAYNANSKVAEADGVLTWIPLTFSGGKVAMENLRFEIDGTEASELVLAPFRLRDGADVRLENCEFVQRRPPSKGWQADIIVLREAGEARPKLVAHACSFKQDSTPPPVAISAGRARTPEVVAAFGAVSVAMTDCAFGPHAALVHLRQRQQEAEVRFSNCTTMLVDGTAFLVEDEVACQLNVHHSLFSRLVPDEAAGDAYLIYQNGDANVKYEGRDNRYHNLTAFRARLSDQTLSTEDYEQFRAGSRVTDQNSIMLDASPWAEFNPLAALDIGRLKLAFSLKTRDAELRCFDNDKRLVGVEVCTWGRSYDILPAPEERAQIIVDPNFTGTGTGDGRNKYYARLEQAVLDAKAGDEQVILIKKTGELGIEPIRLEKAAIDLTIRPYHGFRPVLTLGDIREKDVALFRVQDGKVRFKDLEFHLKTRTRQRDPREGKDTQAVVGMVGHGHCGFENCVVTMDAEGNENATLSVVTLADLGDVMKMGAPAPRAMPEMVFTNCYVRGRGSLVSARASRAFDLRAEQCLISLFGSLCTIEGSTAEKLPATPAQMQLTNVTALVSGNLVFFHTNKDTKDLVPFQAGVRDCILSAAGDKPLVYFDGNVSTIPKRALSWDGRRNIYQNYKIMLDQAKGTEEPAMATALDRDKWKAMMGESDAAFDIVRFLSPLPVGDRSLVEALPSRFKVAVEGDREGKAGVDLTRLPQPRRTPTTAVAPNE
jgi:tRNA A-37 threonylcarbamoyl transferase component Bud32